MNVKMRTVLFTAVLGVVLALLALTATASANHSWNGYHWARTSNPFTVKLGDNVSGLWDAMLVTASNDWTQSNVLNTMVVAGGTSAKSCRPTLGRVEVCNANYRNTGWLGIAQIWLSGGHIAQGTVKNNDYYFGNSTYQYNNAAEMQHVICQEIGHTFGLDHQSTDGSSQNTCMDYYHNTSASDTTSTHPNAHDYDELATIYAHLDSTTTVGRATQIPSEMAKGDFNSQSSWGKLVSQSRNGREATFVRDFGGGNLLVTHVIWAK